MKQTKRTPIATFLTLLSSASLAFSATHTVTSGDSLWRISQQYKVSVAAIQQANNISGNNIALGQILTIPAAIPKAVVVSPTVAPAATSIKPKVNPQGKSHVVAKGENLWRIAKDNNTTMAELMKKNNLSSSVVSVGQVITISGNLPVAKKEVAAIRPTLANLKAEEKKETITKPLKVEPTSSLPTVLKTEQIKEVSKKTVDLTKPRGLEALTKKQRETVRMQIILDRNGMGPGVIDGYAGEFSKTASVLAKTHRSDAFAGEVPLLVERTIPAAVLHFINPTLPGTGKRPDFKKATEEESLMMYKTPIELLAERYHSSENLLVKMNPQIDFANLTVGEKILVPNVSEFKIEDFMDSAGKAVTYKYLRGSRRATSVDVDYLKNRIMVWHYNGVEGSANELLASFPVTTNIKKGPTSQRTIAYFAPAPTYLRKKTGLKLKSGPNSPVGIVWAKLGDGFGIHGTSDGSGNGYNTSSGCIRLSNWDMAVFVKMVPSKTKVNFITGAKIVEKIQPTPKPVKGSVSMIKN